MRVMGNDVRVEQGTSQTVVLGVIGLIALVFIGIFALVALGRDIGNVVLFIGPTLVLLGGILVQLTKTNKLANATEEQTQKLNTISTAVNGALDRKFKAIHDKIDSNHKDVTNTVTALSNQVGLSKIKRTPTRKAAPSD